MNISGALIFRDETLRIIHTAELMIRTTNTGEKIGAARLGYFITFLVIRIVSCRKHTFAVYLLLELDYLQGRH